VLALDQCKGDVVQDLGVSHSDAGEGLGVKFEDSRGDIRDHVSGAGLARQQRHLPDDIALPQAANETGAGGRFQPYLNQTAIDQEQTVARRTLPTKILAGIQPDFPQRGRYLLPSGRGDVPEQREPA